jgi:hypothetical protein
LNVCLLFDDDDEDVTGTGGGSGLTARSGITSHTGQPPQPLLSTISVFSTLNTLNIVNKPHSLKYVVSHKFPSEIHVQLILFYPQLIITKQ